MAHFTLRSLTLTGFLLLAGCSGIPDMSDETVGWSAQKLYTEAKEALATVKQLIATFGFTSQQVFPWRPEEKKKVEARYYDPESGATWTGRGKPPKWIESKDRSQYEIKTTPSVDFNAPRDEKNPFPVQ